MNDNRTVLLILLLLLLWWAFREHKKQAGQAQDFGTDHAPNAGVATSSTPLVPAAPAPPGPAPRTLEQIQADIRTQTQNPAYQAAAANPDVAASNAYAQQFIGKIT